MSLEEGELVFAVRRCECERSFHVINATCDVRELASGLAQEFPVKWLLVMFGNCANNCM